VLIVLPNRWLPVAGEVGQVLLDRAGVGEHAPGVGPPAGGGVEQHGFLDAGQGGEQLMNAHNPNLRGLRVLTPPGRAGALPDAVPAPVLRPMNGTAPVPIGSHMLIGPTVWAAAGPGDPAGL
jgi:hypothetical protein